MNAERALDKIREILGAETRDVFLPTDPGPEPRGYGPRYIDAASGMEVGKTFSRSFPVMIVVVNPEGGYVHSPRFFRNERAAFAFAQANKLNPYILGRGFLDENRQENNGQVHTTPVLEEGVSPSAAAVEAEAPAVASSPVERGMSLADPSAEPSPGPFFMLPPAEG